MTDDSFASLDGELKTHILKLVHAGDLKGATERLKDFIRRADGQSELVGRAHSLLGEVAGMGGHLELAVKHFREAIRALEDTRLYASLARARRALAKVMLVLASAETARVELDQALAVCNHIDNRKIRLTALFESAVLRGFIEVSAGELGAADTACGQAGGYWEQLREFTERPFGEEDIEDLGPSESLAVSEGMWHQLVGIIETKNDATSAAGLRALDHAVRHFQQHGLKYHHARALEAQGRGVAASYPNRGLDLVETARKKYVEMGADFLAERAAAWIEQTERVERSLGGTPLPPIRRVILDPRASEYAGNRLAGRATKRVIQQAIDAGTSPGSVLITGPSGSGKEGVAKAIHYASPRADRPWQAVNCGAFSEHLLDSELFGHERGAFTGAAETKKGIFELADGSTVFLDEIGDASPALQLKLLRVLQEGLVRRVGGRSDIKVDVRVVAATNRDLEREIANKTFREDLFYRLNTIHIAVKPLRERREEIGPLAEALVGKLGREGHDTDQAWIKGEAVGELEQYDWPGNVRELEHFLKATLAKVLRETGRPVITAEYVKHALAPKLRNQTAVRTEESIGEKITAQLLACGWTYSGSFENWFAPIANDAGELAEWVTWANLEAAGQRASMALALIQAGGNQGDAADLIGITRTGVGKAARRLGFTMTGRNLKAL